MRRCLTDQAAGVRSSRIDLAGAAIVRGRRARRRRQAFALASVIGATVLATGVVLQDWPGTGDGAGPAAGVIIEPVPTDPSLDQLDPPPRLAGRPGLPAELAVDLVGAGAAGGLVLAASDGRTLELGPVRDVISAHRVAGGWALVSGHPGTTRLWWVGQDDPRPVSLLAGMDSIVMERARVAWRRGAMLSTATLSGEGALQDRVDTTAPAGDGHPVGFAGPTVLLARVEPAGWDTWRPDRGGYTQAWTGRVLRVYGGAPDGAAAVGLVPPGAGADGPCLARLDPERRLAPTDRSCPPGGLSADGPAALSPHGRWLITTAAGAGGPVLVDVGDVRAGQPVPVIAVPELASLVGRPVWVDPEQALLPGPDRLVRVVPERLFAGDPAGVEVVPLPGGQALVVESL